MSNWFKNAAFLSTLFGKRDAAPGAAAAEENHLQQAQACCDRGDFTQAAVCFNLAVQRDPGLVEGWAGLGKSLFELGRAAEAKDAVAKGVSHCPQSSLLHFMLGNLHVHENDLAAAAVLLRKSVALDARNERAHNNLAIVYRLQGNHAAAVDACDMALSLNPDFADATFNKALALQGLGKTGDAMACYRRLLAAFPDRADASNNLGCLLLDQGRAGEAADCFRQATAHNPGYAEAHFNLGNADKSLGKAEEAARHYRSALALKAGYIDAYLNLGALLQAEKKFGEAVACYRDGLKADSANADLHTSLGAALDGANRTNEAIDSFRRALEHDPGHFGAMTGLAAVLQGQGDIEAAVACYRKALEIHPGHADAWINFGVALQAENRTSEAIDCYRKALVHQPGNCTAHINLAVALQDRHEFGLSLASFDAALAAEPGSAEAHCFRGLLQLQMGDSSGWEGLEYRFKIKDPTSPRRAFDFPRWHRHAELSGKSILLHAEQGLGDTLQFVRYVDRVAALGAVVYLEVQAPLKTLLADFPRVAGVFAMGDALPACDFHCPLGSLPFEFGTDLASIPRQDAYVKAPAERVLYWRDRLPTAGAAPRIGIVWSGNSRHKNNHNRSIALDALLPLFEERACSFHSLQKDMPERDAQALERLSGLTNLAPQLRDFSDTAAVMAHLDLVISVDTSVAHLAGALGKPVWVMLPFNSDFRWLLDRTDSPWYPSMRLYRQTSLGDWAGVIAAMRSDLSAMRRMA